MTNMCTTCGGSLRLDKKTNHLKCEHCGRVYLDESKVPHEIEEICRARQSRSFVVAEELCREFIKKNPTVAEGYWQSLMVELGIVFVGDGENGYKPTFFCFQNDKSQKITATENYKNAIKYAATKEDRQDYERQATYIQKVLEEFFALTAKEESYDIFISFKKSEILTSASGEERSVDTSDYRKAEEIYNALKGKYKVFFSPVSIGKDTGILGEKYEPRILKALQTSQAMILVGTKTEYLEAEWVQNEWKRYRYFIEKGFKKKNSLILGYMGNMPRMPAALKEVQLPNFDMFSASYLKEVEKMLSFVKSSKGMKPKIDGKNIQSGFAEDESAFTTGYEGQRVVIKAGSRGEHVEISATEERDLQFARKVLQNKQFPQTIRKCTEILKKNNESAQAYWLRFCGKIKAINDEAVPQCVANAKSEDFEDFDKAIEFAPDQYFAWGLVDLLLEGLKKGKTITPTLLMAVAKYFDSKRSKKALESVITKLEALVKGNKLKQAEDLFATTRKHLFVQENVDINKWATNEYAIVLFENKKYDNAMKYFEELAASEKNEEYYSYLLSCRLKTPDYKAKKFKLTINDADDASSKKPSELDLDEIIERILICACQNKNRKVQTRVRDMVSYQIRYNTLACTDFIDTVYNVFRQLKMDEVAKSFLKEDVADVLLGMKKFALAEKYYNEIIVLDANAAQAHWGLLKCELHATTDYALACQRRSLDNFYSFNNALNSADQEDYDHFMYVLLAQADREKKEKLKYIDYTSDIDNISLDELKERQRKKAERQKALAQERARDMREAAAKWVDPITWVLFGLAILGIVVSTIGVLSTDGHEQSFISMCAISIMAFLVITVVKNTLKLIQQEKIAAAIFSHLANFVAMAIVFFIAIFVFATLNDGSVELPMGILAIAIGVLVPGIRRTFDVHNNGTSSSTSAAAKGAMWIPVVISVVGAASSLMLLADAPIWGAILAAVIVLAILQFGFNEEAGDGNYDDDYSKIQKLIPAIISAAAMLLLALNIGNIFPIISSIDAGKLSSHWSDISSDFKLMAVIGAILMIILMFILQGEEHDGNELNNFHAIVMPLAGVVGYLIFLFVLGGALNFAITQGYEYIEEGFFDVLFGTILACLPALAFVGVNYAIAIRSESD